MINHSSPVKLITDVIERKRKVERIFRALCYIHTVDSYANELTDVISKNQQITETSSQKRGN